MFSLLSRRVVLVPSASPLRLFSSLPQSQVTQQHSQQINAPLLANFLSRLQFEANSFEAGNRNARKPKKANRGARPVSNAGRRAKRRDHGKWKR
ncbi:hypothetical protein TrVE_jg8867 [Triparma verrucosa]|uniref:Uncharacterized protein n=1 Tax=Triparma verrucosa TaxID=1606542 RepID=A0A9W7BWH1_9STRA|nr:hypothetical protein TrVE_jg8867 [Triparma verrucosa]